MKRTRTIMFFAPGSAAERREVSLHEARGGSALIVVLWVIGLLSMFVVAFAFDMHIESRIASTWRKKVKAEYLAQAGIELARMAMLQTDDPDLTDETLSDYLAKGSDQELRHAVVTLAGGGGAELTRQLGEGSVSVLIQPENSRMNINSMIHAADRELTFETWNPLLEMAGMPREERDALVDCLVDWVDEDEFTYLNGAESSYYETLDPPYKSKNGPLDTVDELFLVKGFDQVIEDSGISVYHVIAPFLTAYSEDQKININSAPAETLTAFFEIDSIIADNIVAERVGQDGIEGTEDDEPFKDIDDLLTRVPILDKSIEEYITFSAMGRFTILSRGQVGDVERMISCVVSLQDKQLQVLSWVQGELPENN